MKVDNRLIKMLCTPVTRVFFNDLLGVLFFFSDAEHDASRAKVFTRTTRGSRELSTSTIPDTDRILSNK